jgi:hypothetical protein
MGVANIANLYQAQALKFACRDVIAKGYGSQTAGTKMAPTSH